MSAASAAAAAVVAAAAGQWLCEANCGRAGTDRCGGCKLFWYCSPTCQKEDWKRQHRHVCAAHKRAATDDADFGAWSPALRLEWLATRLVLATYEGADDSPFTTSRFPAAAAAAPPVHVSPASAALLPAALAPELPKLAVRWFHQAARFSSLGLRDASAYLDWTWDAEHIAPATRMAALAAQWAHVCCFS